MKKKKKTEQQSGLWILWLALPALIILASLPGLVGQGQPPIQQQINVLQGKTPQVKLATKTPKKYTPEEVHIFWKSHLEKVYEALGTRRYKLEEINSLNRKLVLLIEERYGKKLQFSICENLNLNGELILAGSQVKNGIPMAEIVVPAFMGVREEIFSNFPPVIAEQMFEEVCVVSLMHELDHLAYGFVVTDPVQKADFHLEAMAWAKTSENTIRIFMEKSLPVSPAEKLIYANWVRCGRDANSPGWHKFIAEAYAANMGPRR